MDSLSNLNQTKHTIEEGDIITKNIQNIEKKNTSEKLNTLEELTEDLQSSESKLQNSSFSEEKSIIEDTVED